MKQNSDLTKIAQKVSEMYNDYIEIDNANKVEIDEMGNIVLNFIKKPENKNGRADYTRSNSLSQKILNSKLEDNLYQIKNVTECTFGYQVYIKKK